MKIYVYDAIVVGTGAAGYNAACRLKEFGKNVAVVTEGINCSTSRNAGSDKQTYYKLNLCSDNADSVFDMAKDLFSGGCVDGDNALCEAAMSVRSFMHLCELGVRFPTNSFGEYIGYKTDHDPQKRATSAGPYTSKHMTEALQKKAQHLGIEVFSDCLAVEILKNDNTVCGILCIEKQSGNFVAFSCSDIVLATGGPAGIYADSVYPQCHTGTTSLALCAGAKLQNLTEWQYGIATINPRWNVSGTYMQVMPRFVSIDEDGTEYEFLEQYFEDKYDALSNVFMKGYQWPFDIEKVFGGSSVIDLLVWRECVLKKRRVFLDFTKNPFNIEQIEYRRLSHEAYEYLKKAGACFGIPAERLLKMNEPAVKLYKDKDIDIMNERIEIALCAQHCNGGIAVDMWWQTCVKGLFAVGECAGTHGIKRPGGSALNAGQVGALRAAQYIASHPNTPADSLVFEYIASQAEKHHIQLLKSIIKNNCNIKLLIKKAQRRMSDNGSVIRKSENMLMALKETNNELSSLLSTASISEKKEGFLFYKLKDILIMQSAALSAMLSYASQTGDSRGSALYYNKDGFLQNGFEEIFRFCKENKQNRNIIQQISYDGNNFSVQFRDIRPLIKNDDFFENVWRDERNNKNVY